ncbi:hypothetical protein ACFROC_22835 [Nocardia tengchongensis]|uniref:hypothetical protein n=1 Tax=Nocardia tengchongensis TaxID=2055889 RepID=UPI0036B57481
MRWMRSGVFADPPMELTDAERKRGERAARKAARDARKSLVRTKRYQYRRYREKAGDRYLDWQQWRITYLEEYRLGPLPESTRGGISAGDSFLSS